MHLAIGLSRPLAKSRRMGSHAAADQLVVQGEDSGREEHLLQRSHLASQSAVVRNPPAHCVLDKYFSPS